MTNHESSINHYDVIVVGGGQSGVTMSYYLQQAGLSHLVLEKNTLFHGWKNERWDSFTLVTPNWQCDLPGLPYDGNDPKGFMTGKQTVEWLDRFGKSVDAPVKEGVTVQHVFKTQDDIYKVETSQGLFSANQIVVASGGYHLPIIPRMAEKIPKSVHQIHSANYKNSKQLPEGNVLVVGSGQSGAQIAEDLHLDGRKVFLATGNAPRVARFYRGKDVVEWLEDMGYYQMSVKEHSLGENVRQNTNHYVTGRDGGRDIDLRKFATEGMELFGLMTDYNNGKLEFELDLNENLNKADDTYNNINARIDAWIEQQGIQVDEEPSRYSPVWQPEAERGALNLEESGITSIIWCIGFKPGFEWLNAPVFNGQGHPQHDRGITSEPGLYFIGLPWLYTWGSGRFSGVKNDAQYLIEFIADYQKRKNLKNIDQTQKVTESAVVA
ncbi:MSMEG_0569 family flavin-dependent oxidoreductase [Sessilibacter corallicola]|uniref:MSMEG_0569 family flavin-dependent oxidoreductase n=1 Tax=Sessilibacter corallicola TaxID=2904075 RepID=UPI001E55607C|nr:MSMEG_0569 family flavin-dependent oxidoreductase [Sessilibacter corallicola]MCE2029392.1 MSMEG_0569 family flavin-dependent oxidoreductase [Sessilibacter corallicola]